MRDGTEDEREDRQALSVILTGMPPEMMRVLVAMDTPKVAWEMIGDSPDGSACARPRRKCATGNLKVSWEMIRDGESIEDFVLRLTCVVADLELYGNPVTEHKAVQKFLQVVPRMYPRVPLRPQ